MPFHKTDIPDLLIFEPRVFEDSRGYFFEAYNEQVFRNDGINIRFVQDNQSKSSYGVIRGLHYQLNPHAQFKLVRALHGTILDVAVDIRKGSSTFGKHFSIELSAENKRQLLIPAGFAHGFSVLSPTAVVFTNVMQCTIRKAKRVFSTTIFHSTLIGKFLPVKKLYLKRIFNNPFLKIAGIILNLQG